MTASEPYRITLHLAHLQHFFNEQDFDPIQGRFSRLSGVEQIVQELKPLSLRRRLQVTITLPKENVNRYPVGTLSKAVRGYGDEQIRLLDKELASLRWKGIKALQTGGMFLAACLVLSAFFGGLEVLPEFLQTFLGEGFLIAGWVSLWHPIEILLYEWWPFWRDKQLYRRIRDMELIVV